MADWIINRPKATITCSKCKARLNAKLFMDLLEAWNFCPYCGADMRAEQTEPQTMPIKKTMTGTHRERIEYAEAETVVDDEPTMEEWEELQDWKDRMWAEAVIEPQTDCSWK